MYIKGEDLPQIERKAEINTVLHYYLTGAVLIVDQLLPLALLPSSLFLLF